MSNLLQNSDTPKDINQYPILKLVRTSVSLCVHGTLQHILPQFPLNFLGFSSQVCIQPRRRSKAPLLSRNAIKHRLFSESSLNQEVDSMLIMSPTSSSERNKQTMLISDLNNKQRVGKSAGEKCSAASVMSEKASNMSAFDAGAGPQSQVTLGAEPTPSSWCSPLQLGNPRGMFN